MIAVNALSQLTALGGIVLFQTLYVIVVARVLGPEQFGRFAFVWSVVQILLIGGDVGLHNTAVRRISLDRQNSPNLFTTFACLKLFLSTLLLFLVVLISLTIRQTVDTRIALVLFGIGMFFHLNSLSFNSAFQAHQKLYLGSLNMFLIFFFQFLIGTMSLALGGRLVALGFAYLLSTFLALGINYQIFVRKIHAVRFQQPEKWKEFAVESLPVGAGTLFHTVSTRIGVALVSLLAGDYQTGIYSAAHRITSSLSNVPVGIFSAVLPVMASYGEDRRRVRRLFAKSLVSILFFSVPVAFAFFVFAEPLIRLIYGEEYLPSIDNLRILTWSVIPVFVGMAFSHVILSQKALVRFLPVATGVGMLVNIGVNVLLIPRMESAGAAISTLITELVLAVCYAISVRKFLATDATD